MGQQQLLLVILVTIIVGIATVVAINTFSSSADSANIDAVRNDVAYIAAAAQGYYTKPTMLGGGGNDFSDITFNDIIFAADSVNADGKRAINANGVYIIAASTSSFTVTAHPTRRITSTVNFTATATEGAGSLEAEISESNITWTDNN